LVEVLLLAGTGIGIGQFEGLCDGKSGHASFRLLHVFELAADGKIKSERVWIDLAAIQQQLS
jgi:hypothetical protein